MFNEHSAQEREHQRVEHCNLIYTVTVTVLELNAYAFIEGKRRKVYPTGNDNEPWTTSINHSIPKKQ